MRIDFSEVENPDIREAYEKVYSKGVNTRTFEEVCKTVRLIRKLGQWEARKNGEENPDNAELLKTTMGIVREVANDKDGEPNV